MRPLLLVLAAALAGPLGAEVRVVNPGFSGRETAVYTETIGGQTRSFETTLVLTGEGASARLEFRSKGAELESLYRLDPASLLSLSSESLTRAPDAVVRRTAEYISVQPKAEADDLVVTDLGSLPVVLRGYPWGRKAAARIVYVGNTSFGGGISFEVQTSGREAVAAAGRSWDCWRVTTGLGGALSVFLAKTDYWFAAEGTHPLVKVSGPAGGPGSPTRTLVLQSYTVTK